ncbi:ribosomal protein L1 [Schizophyllum commune H4-8]|uniref:Ribosomal protein L1 n=1 Tax=Schizophyllum commune (strain H4-8 / FGSC 9210) TaxID=578458 RepID=D8PZ88_SCHCM|nr:ribosomal protein L1 [Schizophyllum commune H4-8]KAI5896268.1 ribosomal protein L1 [Schizophyllum commune H4-8]
MAADELIDGHVSQKQAEKALNALLAYATKRAEKQAETELLGGREQHIWLNVAEKTIVPNRRLKPQRIPLAHPIIDPRVSSICLLTKDPQRQYKDLLETHKIRFISRVVGVEKLKGKFKPFEARRGLLKDHDMFLADERIIPLLPKLLGTKWFKAKKQPIPVCLTRKDLKGELERAVSSTYMSQNQGTQTSIKIGTISQKPAHLLDNLRTALPAIVARIKGGWENVQNIHIKTSSSTSLPVWSCDLSEDTLGRWGGAADGVKDADVSMDDASEEEEGGSDDEDKEMNEAPVTRAKGKRRAEAEAEEEPAQPKKRAKTSDKPTSKSTDAAAPKMKKPKSKAGVTGATAPPATTKPSAATTTDAAPQDDAAPSAPPSKKRKAKKGDAAEEVAEDVSAPSTKKGKKDGKKDAKAPASDAPVAAEKKKGKKGTEDEASPAPKKSKAAKAEAPAKEVQALAKEVAAPVKKSKAAKESPKKAEAPVKAADAEVDFKKKREGKTGERKKEKVAKARPGKPSAKEGVLGKKALRA